MKFRQSINEVENYVNKPHMSATTNAHTSPDGAISRENAKNAPEAKFYIEYFLKPKTNELIVGGEVVKSYSENLKNLQIKFASPKDFTIELARKLKQLQYTIDKPSFILFIKQLADKVKNTGIRNKAFAYKDATKANPSPKWDAYFELYRKSGTGNELAFRDLGTEAGTQTIKNHPDFEKEQYESNGR